MNTQVEQETAKRAVAKHSLLDAQGNLVESTEANDAMELATGIRYQDLETGETVDFQYKPNTDSARMGWLFGMKTLATNIASGVRNGKEGGGGKEQVAAIVERFKLIDSGTWADRTREGGPRLDQEVLADVVCDLMIQLGKFSAETKDEQRKKLLAKWAADPKLVSQSHSVPQVRDEYAKRVGRTARTVDDLVGMLS